MSERRPIDRVRSRTENEPDLFETDRDTFAQKQDKLHREAPLDQRQPTDESEEDMKERVSDQLKKAQDKFASEDGT